MSKNLNIKNKRARFEYSILATYNAGIILTGTEIKSIRLGEAHIAESFCQVKNDEVFIVNMHINEYEFGNIANHLPTRTRKLLLNKKEIKQISKKIVEKGFTLIPLKVFLSERGFAKVEVAIAKGKQIHDKRQSLKDKDNKREMDRMKNSY